MTERPKHRWLDWTIRAIYLAIIVALILLLIPSPFVRVQREAAVSPDDSSWQRIGISANLISD
jgi:hypothetical protein